MNMDIPPYVKPIGWCNWSPEFEREFFNLVALTEKYSTPAHFDLSLDAETRHAVTETIVSTVKRKVEQFPQLVFVNYLDGTTLLSHCQKIFFLHTYYLGDVSNLSSWHSLIKWLIEANPHALTWYYERSRSMLDLLTICVDVTKPIVDFITRRYIWVFGRVQDFKLNWQFATRDFDPAERLIVLHTQGFVPASTVKTYCELFPHALTSQPGFGTLLHCSLLWRRVCSANLFKWMARKVPEAMTRQNEYGRTPLHIACAQLGHAQDTEFRADELYLFEDSIPDLTEICLFIISECPQAIFIEDCEAMSPLDYLVVDECVHGEVILLVDTMITAIQWLHPGCMLPGRGEESTNEGYECIRGLNCYGKKQAFLRQEARDISIAKGLLESVRFDSLKEAFVCWSSSRLQAVNAEVDPLEAMFYRALNKYKLTWEQYRYCPFDNWSEI